MTGAAPGGDDLWNRALAAFDRWAGLPATDRQRELQRIAAEDAALHAKLVALIESDRAAEADAFLAGTAIGDTRAHQPAAAPAAGRIGPWVLERELGAGGMGRVWLARRVDGLYEGRAAIKMLRDTVGGAQADERFAREGRILARLAHPNIARLLDAGTLPDGQRYLVIEYVEGVRIDEYCEARRLGIRERIGLFLQVCAAVTHAHANLVVHRDLKPANILVLGDGQVKLLDFGVAKLLERDETAAAGLTQQVGAALTPEYAAPEQVESGAITTATDVYSLGVVLYRLLCGVRPYGAAGQSPVRLLRDIVETDPRRMSGQFAAWTTDPALHELARARGTAPRRLRRLLSGDLDSIVAKAMRKLPPQRHPSVQALADDLCAYLDNRPVGARQGDLRYRIRKFVRRNWIGVSGSLALAGALAAGVIGTTWQARIALHNEAEAQRQAQAALANEAKARQQEQLAREQAARATLEEARAHTERATAERFRAQAQHEAEYAKKQELAAREQARVAASAAERADAIKDFMIDVFRANLPASGNIETAQAVTAKELLEAGSKRINASFAQQPAIKADLLDIIGELFYRLGDEAKARQLTLERLEALKRVPENTENTRLQTLHNLGYLGWATGDTAAVRGTIAQAAPLAAAGGLEEKGYSLSTGARLELYHSPAAAVTQATAALEAFRPFEHIDVPANAVATAWESIARAESLLGRHDRALSAAQAARAAIRRVAPESRYSVATRTGLVGQIERSAGMYAEAERSLRTASTELARSLGATHPETLVVRAQLGALLHAGSKREEGLALLADAVRQMARSVGRHHIEEARMRLELAHAYHAEGRFAEAEAEAGLVARELQDNADLRILRAFALQLLGRVRSVRGDDDGATSAARNALDILKLALGEETPTITMPAIVLAEAQTAADRIADGRVTIASLERVPDAQGARFSEAAVRRNLLSAEMRLSWGEKQASLMQFERSIRALEDSPERDFHRDLLARAHLGAGKALIVIANFARANAELSQAIELRRQAGPADSPWLAEAKVLLADCLLYQGDRKRAARLLEEAVAVYEQHAPLARRFTFALDKVRARL